jgi:hypothetical protein
MTDGAMNAINLDGNTVGISWTIPLYRTRLITSANGTIITLEGSTTNGACARPCIVPLLVISALVIYNNGGLAIYGSLTNPLIGI